MHLKQDISKMDYHKINMKIIMIQLNNRRNQEELPAQKFLESAVLSTLNALKIFLAISKDSHNTAIIEKIQHNKNTITPLFSKETCFSRTFSTSDLNYYEKISDSEELNNS
jgi:hypothetical protein